MTILPLPRVLTPGRLLALLLALFLLPGTQAAAPSGTGEGSGSWRWNVDLLRPAGLVADVAATGPGAATQWRAQALATRGALDVHLEFGHFPVARGGTVELAGATGLRRLQAGPKDPAWSRVLARMALRPLATDGNRLEVVDGDGHPWFILGDGHRYYAAGQVRYENMDARISPQLAKALGDARLAGIAVAAVDLLLPVATLTSDASPGASCSAPDWPGTPGTFVDVALTDITYTQAQCSVPCANCVNECNGAGGNPQARVKITPSAKLANVGTAYVPWQRRFTSEGAPGTTVVSFSHPYLQKDVHPFLAWNLYRINESGQLEQVGRSGGKHAFATDNAGCVCSEDNHILGPGCADEYSAATNDFSYFLSPRKEVLAHTAQWGRCHSFYDPDCDGFDNATAQGDFDQRAYLTEAELVAHPAPASRYFVEAWYLVRDDSNFDNSIGWVEVSPQWNGAMWLTPAVTAFQNGPVIDRWLPRNTLTATTAHRVVDTAYGSLHLAVKVSPVAGAKYRYDYALYNRDFGIPLTAGSEPAMDLVSYRGIAALRLPVGAQTVVESYQFFDGDGDGGNGWTLARNGSSVAIDAPVGTSLDWGTLYRISFIADAAPVAATATLVLATGGVIADPAVTTLVPADSFNLLFGDGFE